MMGAVADHARDGDRRTVWSGDRASLFFAAALLVTLNAFAGPIGRSVMELGLASAANGLFGLTAVQWVALPAALAILATGEVEEPVRRWDLPIVGAACLATLSPVAIVATVGLTGLGIWAVATGGRDRPVWRAGLILAGLATTLLWGPMVLIAFGKELLLADAAVVQAWAGGVRDGNLITNGAWRIVVGPGCSSLHGISGTVLLWMTITQFYRVPLDRRQLGWCAAAVTATVAINCLRMGAMVIWPKHFPMIHDGWGAAAAMWGTLLSVTALCLFAGRDAIFARR